MFRVLTTVPKDSLDALEVTGKIVRTIGPELGLGDTCYLYCHGIVEMPMPLHPDYETIWLSALNTLEHQAKVLVTGKRVAKQTLYLYYGEEFLDFTPGLLKMTIPENYKPFGRMPLSLLTMDPHDVIVDHIVSLSGAELDVIHNGEIVSYPEFGCLALKLDVA